MKIDFIQGSDSKERQEIGENLRAFNRTIAGDSKFREFTLAVRNDEGTLVAGLNGKLYWNWLFVDHLWIAESERGKNLGSKLLTQAEAYARSEGCSAVHLDTFSFQARGFYEKLGYRQFAELENYPTGHSRHFLWKPLK
jgi:GNAT superfamily N-acetyltransferase